MREILAAVVGSCALFSAGAAVQGAVTTVNYFQFGEIDGAGGTAATAGALVGTTTKQTTGSFALERAVGGTYSSDAPDPSKLPAGTTSSLSLALGGSDWFKSSLITNFSDVDNFGIELWVKPASLTGSQVLVYDGYPSQSGGGRGLRLNGSKIEISLGGIGTTQFTVPEIAIGTWTHLAMVRDSGSMRLYVNGIATGPTIADTPFTPNTQIGVGAYQYGGSYFTGNIDNLRMFTFAPGQFSSSDLLVNAPEPSMIGLAGMGVLGLLRRRQRVV